MHTLTLRGLPRSLNRDGWWLASDSTPPGPPPPIPTAAAPDLPGTPRSGLLLGLVALADLLFWEAPLGLSMAVYALAVFAAAVLDLRPRRDLRLPLIVLTAAILPVIEMAQTLSVVFLLGGLVTAILLTRLPAPVRLEDLAQALRHLLASAPASGPRALARAVRAPQGRGQTLLAPRRQVLTGWAFPLGGALILSGLLLSANPILADALTRTLQALTPTSLTAEDILVRPLFWLGAGFVLWPLLTARAAATPAPDWQAPDYAPPGLNRASVLNALWLFNAMLGVQTLMDAAILLGGASLPEGMSHAEYAHRGAYPLLLTAMLAGAFALAARPFWDEHRLTRPLLILWLVQNVALCASAALRLELYMEAFGLTYLRLYALIWMGVVACGLGLTLWQILTRRSTPWLIARAAVLGLAVLYASAFVNFADIIARQNLARAVDRPDVPIDHAYLCKLGPTAGAAILQQVRAHPELRSKRAVHCGPLSRPMPDWRGWGFRQARVNHTVWSITGGPDENPFGR